MRGGRRNGAGRRRQLSDDVRFEIGDACELRAKARSASTGYLRAYELDPLRPDFASVTFKRRHGFRAKIIATVARNFIQAAGAGISEGMVTRCWTEFRAGKKGPGARGRCQGHSARPFPSG